MAENYIEVTKDNFTEKVLHATQLTVVLFWSKQSNTSQIQEPEIEAVSREYQGRAQFARLDVSNHEELTNQWKVEGIPTLLFFKGGNEIYRITGIVMRDKLRRQIEGILLTE